MPFLRTLRRLSAVAVGTLTLTSCLDPLSPLEDYGAAGSCGRNGSGSADGPIQLVMACEGAPPAEPESLAEARLP